MAALSSYANRAVEHDPSVPSMVLPQQFYQRSDRGFRLPPEQQLMAAVLDDALDILRKGRRLRGRKGRKLYLETKTWFESDDETWPYSFANICASLGLERVAVRQALAREEAALRLAA